MEYLYQWLFFIVSTVNAVAEEGAGPKDKDKVCSNAPFSRNEIMTPVSEVLGSFGGLSEENVLNQNISGTATVLSDEKPLKVLTMVQPSANDNAATNLEKLKEDFLLSAFVAKDDVNHFLIQPSMKTKSEKKKKKKAAALTSAMSSFEDYGRNIITQKGLLSTSDHSKSFVGRVPRSVLQNPAIITEVGNDTSAEDIAVGETQAQQDHLRTNIVASDNSYQEDQSAKTTLEGASVNDVPLTAKESSETPNSLSELDDVVSAHTASDGGEDGDSVTLVDVPQSVTLNGIICNVPKHTNFSQSFLGNSLCEIPLTKFHCGENCLSFLSECSGNSTCGGIHCLNNVISSISNATLATVDVCPNYTEASNSSRETAFSKVVCCSVLKKLVEPVGVNTFPRSDMTSSTQTLKLETGVLQYSQYSNIMRYVRMVEPGLICVPMFCGIISAIVFAHKKLRNSVATLIIAFNIAESLKSACFIINRTWRAFQMGSQLTWSSAFTRFFIYFVIWIPDAFGRMAVILNSIIALEKFIMIAFPLKMMNKTLIRYPRTVVGIVVFGTLIFQLIRLILILAGDTMNKNPEATFNSDEIISTIAITIPDEMDTYRKLHVIGSTLFRYLPMSAALVINTLTIIQLIRHERGRREMFNSTGQSRAQAVTLQTNAMIVVSSLGFAILVTFKPVVRIVGLLHPTFGDGKQEVYLYAMIQEMSIFVDNLSPLVTFITYARMSTLFRFCFWQQFAFLARNHNGNSTASERLTESSSQMKTAPSQI